MREARVQSLHAPDFFEYSLMATNEVHTCQDHKRVLTESSLGPNTYWAENAKRTHAPQTVVVYSRRGFTVVHGLQPRIVYNRKRFTVKAVHSRKYKTFTAENIRRSQPKTPKFLPKTRFFNFLAPKLDQKVVFMKNTKN